MKRFCALTILTAFLLSIYVYFHDQSSYSTMHPLETADITHFYDHGSGHAFYDLGDGKLKVVVSWALPVEQLLPILLLVFAVPVWYYLRVFLLLRPIMYQSNYVISSPSYKR
ncbi:hypothetical protein M3202_10625 [Alkalihalobacillus oceani]|uniref:Uncharacterized protein n=1 Tax=Halalkalibacter oceani TaxID=1653776 RepID=A0A9X2DQC3_9BACI|nr:hypothetical protein [Halalkalibacter oceani]MCM3714543.1 hypothetical protein [Halalkalibacter oceani]